MKPVRIDVLVRPKTLICLLASFLCAASASALEVVYDDRTPQNLREWADRCCVREQMCVLVEKICKALYGDGERSRLHEKTKIVLYLAPQKGGNPAFAAGRRITWKVGENPGGDASGGMGLLCHEMTHVLDMGSDRMFTEAMADWTRNYKVWYHRCTDPAAILDKRYRALRGGRKYGKYMSGANFIDFMTQTYGEGTIYRILQGYKKDGKDHWQKTFGKDFDGLLAEWKTMETIYDPVFQWTYNGTAAGVVRKDKKFCRLGGIAATDAADKSGAWLDGPTAGRVENHDGGGVSISLHGWFPRGGAQIAIASLGAAKESDGKAVLLATGQKRDTLYAHVVATLHGKPCTIVAARRIPVPALATKPHAIILSVAGGDEARISVDGKAPVVVDMKSQCAGCTFVPAFAVGGMSGGIGVAGFAEPRGEKGFRLDDVRVFSRAFRDRETKQYAATFDEKYRPAVATTARWCGAPGGRELDDPKNWYCVNSVGEKIHALPTKDTDVLVSGRAIPNISPNARFACKSFTIDGWALVEDEDVDLRGVKNVTVPDNAKIVTRDGKVLRLPAVAGRHKAKAHSAAQKK